MISKRGFMYFLVLIVLLVMGSGLAGAQQTQPQKKQQMRQQRPGGRKGAGGANRQTNQAVTPQELAGIVKHFMERQATFQGGAFVYYDQETKKPVVLTLDKVHEDRLTKTGPNSYVVCADLKSLEGKAYDFDFLMAGDGGKRPRLTEVSIHKADGKERYSWVEENGVWQKKLGAGAAKAAEKAPEKPAEKKAEPPKSGK